MDCKEMSTTKCTECGMEFETAIEGCDHHREYLGSVKCPYCGAIVDMDAGSFRDYCELAMISQENTEYQEFCERNSC